VRDTIRKVRDAGFRVFYNNRGPNRHVDVLFVNRLCMGGIALGLEMARHWAPRIVRSAGAGSLARNKGRVTLLLGL